LSDEFLFWQKHIHYKEGEEDEGLQRTGTYTLHCPICGEKIDITLRIFRRRYWKELSYPNTNRAVGHLMREGAKEFLERTSENGEKKYRCVLCGESSKSRAEIVFHIVLRHLDEVKKVFQTKKKKKIKKKTTD